MATKGYPTYPFLPRITEDSLPFWQGCAQHELRYQRCTHCGKPRMPASFLCPDCLSPDFVWEPAVAEERSTALSSFTGRSIPPWPTAFPMQLRPLISTKAYVC